MCLGQDDKIDFKEILRSRDRNKLNDAIDLAMRKKPEKQTSYCWVRDHIQINTII